MFIFIYATFVCGSLVGTVWFVSANQMPRILSLILGVEQVRKDGIRRRVRSYSVMFSLGEGVYEELLIHT